MNSESRDEAAFEAALKLPPDERPGYLAKECADEPELRQRVEALLGAFERAGGFMKEPAVEMPAQTVRSPALPTEKPGDRIGRYKLLQQIGEGGCGVVYMAEQEEPVRRRVALKVIKLGMDTKQVIARFEAERQALALMDHPNIAKVFDAGATETGRPYFVMELVRGVKITEYCDEAKLSTRARLDLFVQVCQAIQHAHQKGIIHRDIKPSNILVTVNDGVAVPKVIDFGIAKATSGQQLTDKTLFTAFEQFIGTPAYMSPEQAVMTSLDIDTRSDIYGLGVLLYELLTGKTPFDAKELLAAGLDEMRRTIREQEPLRPSTCLSTLSDPELSTTAHRRGLDAPKLVSELRGDLDWIVMKALEKDRARRYETANGLAADVQRHLNNEPVVACPPSRVYRFQKMARRNKLAFAAVGGVVAALLVGLGIATWMFQRERAARQQANEQIAIAQAVNDFLQKDLLLQASSGSQAGRGYSPEPNLTVREAVDRAANGIEERFKDHPLQEAAVRVAIGNALEGVGEAPRAISHLERAMELFRARLGPNHRNTLTSMHHLARVYWSAGKFEQSLLLGKETLKLREVRLGPDHPDTLSSMVNLANFYSDVGKDEEALPLLEKALKLCKVSLGTNHSTTLLAMNNVAANYDRGGKRDQALPLYRDALQLSKAKLGADHPTTLLLTINLAGVYPPVEGIPLFEEALKRCQARLGPSHQYTLMAMNDLASTYNSAGKRDQALTLFRDTLQLSKAKLGADHPFTLKVMDNLAWVYPNAEAIPLLEEALKLRQAKLGPDHPATLNSMNALAGAYERAGKFDQALPLLEKTLELRKTRLGRDHKDTLDTMKDLASACAEAGKTDQSLKLSEERLNLMRTKLGPDHKDTLPSIRRVAEFRARLGQFTEAAAGFAQLIEHKPAPDREAENQEDWHKLIAILVQQGDISRYREHCRRSVERFGDSKKSLVAHRIVKGCLILPDSGMDLRIVDRLADFSVSKETNSGSRAATKALAEYRLGRFASAADWAEKALTNATKPGWVTVHASAALAMARRQLKQNELSQAALARAQDDGDKHLPKLDSLSWVDVIIAHALLREAKALVEGRSEAKTETK